MQFDDVKTKIKEHPVETVAIVIGVSGLVYLHRQRKLEKKRQHELELAKIKAMTPPKRPVFGRRRQYSLDFAA